MKLQGGADSVAGSKDPKLGIIAIRLKCHAESLADALTGAVPDFGLTGLVENQARTFSRRMAGDVEGYDVGITMEGHQTPDAAEGVEYSLEGTTSEDPIETHPEYQALLDIYGGTPNAEGKAKWDKELPAAGNSVAFSLPGFEGFGTTALDENGGGSTGQRNPMHGVESYLVPGLTWTRKSVGRRLPAELVRSLGTIDTPPGNPPELSGNRNWLKIRVRATWRGNVWAIEETWLLSGPEGWVPEMYRYH